MHHLESLTKLCNMLHSKFSTSFDEDSVTIFIEHKVNEERTFLAPTFYFDEQGNLQIPRNQRETFKYLTRHIKSTIADFKKYLEESKQLNYI